MPGMGVREEETEYEVLKRKADILEKDEGHDQREEQEEGEGDCWCR